MAAKVPSIAKMTQQQVLNGLGAPNMKWFDLWEDTNIRAVYERLREFDDRLRRTSKSKKARGGSVQIWKSESFILARLTQDPHKFSPENEDKRFANWTRSDILVYSVKEIIDLCDYFPAFDGPGYTRDHARAALSLLAKIASACKGRKMSQVHPRVDKDRLGPVLQSEGDDWWEVLVPRVYNWMGEFITAGMVLPNDHQSFALQRAVMLSERIPVDVSETVEDSSDSEETGSQQTNRQLTVSD